jgi:glycosyltransferase involved in cell wall biosynthesis
MKIVIVANRYPHAGDEVGGAFVKEFAKALARERHACTVVSPWNAASLRGRPAPRRRLLEDAGDGTAVEVRRPRFLSFSARRLGPWNSARWTQASHSAAVAREIRSLSERPDVLYGHFLHPAGCSSVRTGSALGIPAFAGVGEGALWSLDWLDEEEERREFAAAAGVLVVSSPLKREVARRLAIPDARLGLFPNGVDLDVLSPRDRTACRKELGLPEERFLVAFVGSFVEQKGPHRLLEAVKGLDGAGLLLLGSGPLRLDGPQVVVRARVDHDRIATYLSAADLFVLPTEIEGSCNSLIEAMACGLPIVTSDGEYTSDLVDDDVAIRVDPRDVGAIRRAVKELMADPGRRRAMSEAGRARAKTFDIRLRARAVAAWMERLAAGSRER